jgi:hypothetical protein
VTPGPRKLTADDVVAAVAVAVIVGIMLIVILSL